MTEFFLLVRQLVTRWQLRSLERQAASIIEARNSALRTLVEIQRERKLKAEQLSACVASRHKILLRRTRGS